MAFEMAFVAEALRDAANRGPSELVADAILARTSNAPRQYPVCAPVFREHSGAGRYRGRESAAQMDSVAKSCTACQRYTNMRFTLSRSILRQEPNVK